jgi:hypothetical protein
MALALLVSMAATRAYAGAQRPTLAAACVAFDLHVLTLIEDHGLAEGTDPETLRDAAFQMLEARVACREGDAQRALQIYSSINLDHLPMTPLYRVLMR